MVGLARLGLKTGFIGKVACDREGKLLLEDFRLEGIDLSGIRVDKNGRSGVAMGFVDENGERALYIDAGVNDTIKNTELEMNYASRAKLLHLTSFVGEQSFQAQKRLVEKIPRSVKVSFDPGTLYARRGYTQLESIIKRAFVLMPNSIELRLLTGLADYKKGAELFLEKGVKIVAVKVGSKGCYVTDKKGGHLIEAFRVKVVDTTGAGDAFDAGFLYGLLSGRGLCECGKLGNFVASRCIMKIGARTGLPHLEDLHILG
jgi:ribokinase